jgi:hypothetical protein
VTGWEEEFRRRVTKALLPEHYEHGFRADAVEATGSDGGVWSSWTWEDPSLSVSVSGACSCGKQVYGSADSPEEIAHLLRAITQPNPACGHGGPMWKLDGDSWACKLPQGHDGDHSAEDGTWWPPEVTR